MIHRGVNSEVRVTHRGTELLFICCELQVKNVRSVMKEYEKEKPLINSDKSYCARSENVYGRCSTGLFKVGKS